MSDRISKKPKTLQLVTEPKEFFLEMVSTALGRRRVQVQPETEFYLVHVLEQFMMSENLFPTNGQGNFEDTPLFKILKEALEEPRPEHQALMFRRLGDVSLYVAGFFQESLRRRAIDPGYYIEMGGTAYQQVSRRVDQSPHQEIFEELAVKFSKMVDVFGDISERTTTPGSQMDILKFYDMWLSTGSERAEKILRDAGIVPEKNLKKKLQ